MTRIKRAVAVWIDHTTLLHFVVYFAAGVVSFALFYYSLTPGSNGLVSNASTPIPITFGVATYFSVVTITTLGYGDIIPQGLSRLIACLEVIFGLTMMGVIITKLTSMRLSYHVRRLFNSDTQRRLEDYSSGFDLVQTQFSRLSPMIGNAFQEIPKTNVTNNQKQGASEFSQTLIEFHSKSLAFCRYIEYELGQGDFFSDAPIEALQKTAASIEQSLFQIGQLILGFPISARPILLNKNNRQYISETLDSHRELCEKVNTHSKNELLKRTFGQIAEACRTIPENYYNVPETMDHRPPDLVAPITEEPQ